MQIDCFDYLVFIVCDIDVSIDFYICVLGMCVVIFGVGCKVFVFGVQKINLYQVGGEFEFKVE